MRFTVSFTVYDVSELRTPNMAPADVLVVVRSAGREHSTDVKLGKTTIANWEESVTWDSVDIAKDELDYKTIDFEVQGANAFWRNDTIGIAAVNLAAVNRRRDHRLKTGVPLTLPNDPEIKGKLNVYVSVLGEQDAAPGLEMTEDEAVALDDLDNAYVGAMGEDMKDDNVSFFQVDISVFMVEDLDPLMSRRTFSPFVVVEFGRHRLRGFTAKGVRNHRFNECFRFYVTAPSTADAFLVSLWDEASDNFLIAKGTFSLVELRGKAVAPTWFSFYGYGHVGEELDATEHPPTVPLGRLLLSARCRRLSGREEMQPNQVVFAKALDLPESVPRYLMADVYEVQRSGNSSPGEAVQVIVSVGGVENATPIKRAATASSNERVSFPDGRVPRLDLETTADLKQNWDICIAVGNDKGDRVAAMRIRADHVAEESSGLPNTPIWVPLNSLNVRGQAENISVLLGIGYSTDPNKRSNRASLKFVPYFMRCAVLACRHLTPNSPSPLVIVSFGGESVKSASRRDTKFPVFCDLVSINTMIPTDRHSGVPTLAPVTLYVVDVQTDDNALIGKVSTYISQITVPPLPGQSASATAKPKWLKLKGGRGFQERTGDILVALDLIRPQYATVVPPPVSSPPLRKFGLMISHVGLRNLIRTSKPASLLMSFLGGQQEAEPIKLPIVQMLLPDYTNLGSDLVETWLEWQPSGYSDPTTVNKKYLSGTTPLSNFDWFFVLHADVVLPRDPVYDPFLVLKFYDSSARRRNIIGEGCVRLLDLLPTVKSVATTLMAVEPLDDYSRVFDPRKLLQLSLDLRQQMMARQLQQGSGTMRALGVDVLEEAENKENEDANADEKALKAFIEDDTEKPDDWIHPKGLPFQLLDAYASIVRAGLKVHRISKNMVTLNVRVPRNYLLTASGPSSRSALKDRINRISGTIEQITADVPWQVVPLTRRVEGKLLCTGQSRIVVGIKYKEAVKYMGRKSATSASRTPGYLQDERVMYKKLRGNLPPRLHIRLYVLNGVGITAVPGQISGPLNPYLVFYCGDQKSSARQVAPKATNNPSWYYVFEREVNMPEQAVVEIAVWQKQDEDDPRRDVRIGSGKIDLETRWLSDAWQSLKNRRKFPYETLLLTRTLDGLGGCGSVEFLLEAFLPAESASWVPRDLKQADAGFVEVRVVVWGVRAANIALTGKESLDALVKISVDCPQYKGAFAAQQETDIHFNSTNGNAVFNWRCVFPQIELPGGMCLLQLSLYDDRGPIAAPCFIGEANLDLRRYLAQCLKQGAKLEYDLEAKLNNDQQKPGEVVGYIQCTVQIVPQRDATEVGLGRGEPNTDPSLTKPSAGRKWSDWLSSGAKQNANKWYRRFQIAFLILGFLALFVIFFLIPGLFWQVKPISTIP